MRCLILICGLYPFHVAQRPFHLIRRAGPDSSKMLRMTSLIAATALAAAHTRDTYNAEEFVLAGRAPADARMVFSAALPSRNSDKLDQILGEIADPTNAKYGQWLTQQEVVDLTAPEPAIRLEVHDWYVAVCASCQTSKPRGPVWIKFSRSPFPLKATARKLCTLMQLLSL